MGHRIKLILGIILIILLSNLPTFKLIWANPDSEMPIDPHSFIKESSIIMENDTGTIKVFDGQTGEMKTSSSDLTTVWNWTRDSGLTSGRTWKEKIQFRGIFSIDYNAPKRQLFIGNYTILDFSGALLRVKDDTGCDDDYGIFRNLDTPATDIEIRNFKFDENVEGAPDSWGYVLWFSSLSNFLIEDCDFSSPDINYEILIDGTGSGSTIKTSRFDHNNLVINQDDFTFVNNHLIGRLKVTGDRGQINNNDVVKGGLRFEGSYGVVSGNTINATYSACGISATGDENTVSDNTISSVATTTLWIDLGEGTGSTVSGNTLRGYNIENCHGIANTQDGGGENAITGNNLKTFYEGITVWMNNEKSTVVGNRIENCLKGINPYSTISPLIEGNTFTDNNHSIYIDGFSTSVKSKNGVIRGNLFNGTGNSIYFLSGRNTGWRVYDNIFEQETVYDGTPSDVTFKYNEGFATENSVTFTDISNGTYVEHGCAGTPDYITITLSTLGYAWYGTKNSTHCQLYFSTPIASGTAKFEYEV